MSTTKEIVSTSAEQAVEMGFKEKPYRPWPKPSENFFVMEHQKFIDLLWKRNNDLVYLGSVLNTQ
jgi:hypothetical protein